MPSFRFALLLFMIPFTGKAQTLPKPADLMIHARVNERGELFVTASPGSRSTDFDFLTGTHTVQHHKRNKRLTSASDWSDFEGWHQQESILAGAGNLEQHRMSGRDGSTVEGMALRLFDPQTRLWTIYWADSESGELDPPMVGSFENNVGHFYGRDSWEGRPVLVQFVWDATDASEPKWSQAFSTDNGASWEWNWYMSFHKTNRPEGLFPERTAERTGVLEFRNYRLQEGQRDAFIAYFEQHLIQEQESMGGFPLGQYRLGDQPDRVFWIRGFSSMAARSSFLPAFYFGDYWKQHRMAVNRLIANNDLVHLLRPLVRAHEELVPAALDRGSLQPYNRFAVLDCYISNTKKAALKAFFARSYLPLMGACGIDNVRVFESEPAVNDFPRLPVFQDPDLLVTLSFYRDEPEYREKNKLLAQKRKEELKDLWDDLVTIHTTQLLLPTEYTAQGGSDLSAPLQSIPFQTQRPAVDAEGTLHVQPSATSNPQDFDFLLGHHRIVHQRLERRLQGSQSWKASPGSKTTEVLLQGLGNIERHFLCDSEGNPIEAIALRLFNPRTRLWSLYWADSRSMTLDPPVRGSFAGTLGTFFGKDHWNGKEVWVQFQYDRSDPDRPVWGQAFSGDGRTWEWNWVMRFEKVGALQNTQK